MYLVVTEIDGHSLAYFVTHLALNLKTSTTMFAHVLLDILLHLKPSPTLLAQEGLLIGVLNQRMHLHFYQFRKLHMTVRTKEAIPCYSNFCLVQAIFLFN